jgi:hypothetical protein
VAMSITLNKTVRSQISNPVLLQLNLPGKQEQAKPNIWIRKDIIKIRDEINERGQKSNTENQWNKKINRLKGWVRLIKP